MISGIFILLCFCCFFFFKQKTAYEMRISDWSSDVCSSDLADGHCHGFDRVVGDQADRGIERIAGREGHPALLKLERAARKVERAAHQLDLPGYPRRLRRPAEHDVRSEERRVGKESVSTCRSRW